MYCVWQLYPSSYLMSSQGLHMPWNLWDWCPACRCGQNYQGSKPGTKSTDRGEIVLKSYSWGVNQQCGVNVTKPLVWSAVVFSFFRMVHNATCPVSPANAGTPESWCPPALAGPDRMRLQILTAERTARNLSLGCHWVFTQSTMSRADASLPFYPVLSCSIRLNHTSLLDTRTCISYDFVEALCATAFSGRL